MSRRYYQLKIFPRGAVSTTGAASYTLGSSYFRDAPLVGGPIIRAAQCQVESNPWRVTLVDIGSTFTAKIADSSGRLHLLGRLCQLKSALDSTASFSPIGTGRLTDLGLNADVASWDLDISDERWAERQTDLFTKSNTYAIVPYGPTAAFQQIAGIPNSRWRCAQKVGNLVCLRYDGPAPIQVPDATVPQLIVSDLKLGTIPGNSGIASGNFTTLRWHNSSNATDYEIAAFGTEPIIAGNRPRYPTHNLLGWWNDPTLIADLANPPSGVMAVNAKLYVWVVWTASTPALDADTNGYLYAPTHEPTPALPLLVGGSTGLHPGKFTRNCYSGSYSASTALLPRFSTAAFDRWENEPAYGRVWWQIQGPQNMATFLDDRIYGPYSVAPVPDSSGKIAPTRMWLPTSTQLNVAGLATLTSTNMLTHPTWMNPSREAVTAIRYTYETYGSYGWGNPILTKPTTNTGTTFTYDTVSLLGRRQLTFRLGSVSILLSPIASTAIFPTAFASPASMPMILKLANSIFMRFADGPIYSDVEVSSSIDQTTNGAILPGAFVKMKLGTYPNAMSLARSGTRIMQVLKRDITPRGRAFQLLDAASTLASLAAPTVTMALSSQSSRHAVKLTVASMTAGARWEGHVAPSSSTGAASPPAANSNRWFPAVYATTANLSVVVGFRASNTKYWARVRQAKPNRIASPWSTANVSVVTAKITGPSAFSGVSITAGSAIAKWTNGSSVYPLQVMIDATSNATLGDANIVAQVPAMTTRYTILGLTSNTKHKGGVRHFDAYGGKSTQATATIQSTTGYTAAPSLRGLVILNQG